MPRGNALPLPLRHQKCVNNNFRQRSITFLQSELNLLEENKAPVTYVNFY